MDANGFTRKLQKLRGFIAVFSLHAQIRLQQRQIPESIVREHLRNPVSLKLVESLKARKGEEKYKLWFVPYKKIAYTYVIAINHPEQRIVVITLVKQRLDWQKKAEGYVK